jgi:hypothetical protein
VTSDYSGALERYELVFDPRTSELLAEREVLLERAKFLDAKPGTVVGYAVYLEAATTSSIHKRP